MKTRIAAVAAGLLLGVASPASATLPICPATFTSILTSFELQPLCRIGRFTLGPWAYDDDFGISQPWNKQFSFQLFDNRLEFTVKALIPEVDYSMTSNQFQDSYWLTEQFAFVMTADDPTTLFYASSVRFPGTANFALFDPAQTANVVASAGVNSALASTGYQSGVGCAFSGTGSYTCPSAISGLGPALGGGVAGSAIFRTQFQSNIYAPTLGTTIDVQLIDPSWTAIIYFTAPSVVPEPSTLALLATGFVAIGLVTRRRRRLAGGRNIIEGS